MTLDVFQTDVSEDFGICNEVRLASSQDLESLVAKEWDRGTFGVEISNLVWFRLAKNVYIAPLSVIAKDILVWWKFSQETSEKRNVWS